MISVERCYGEARERTLIADDVIARPDKHHSILSPSEFIR